MYVVSNFKQMPEDCFWYLLHRLLSEPTKFGHIFRKVMLSSYLLFQKKIVRKRLMDFDSVKLLAMNLCITFQFLKLMIHLNAPSDLQFSFKT